MGHKTNDHLHRFQYCDWRSPEDAGLSYFGSLDTNDEEEIQVMTSGKAGGL